MRQAGSAEAFRRVDLDYPVALARAALARGARHFLLVTAVGASTDSRFFYNRVKGEVETAIAGLGFRTVTIARPSLLLGDRGTFRWAEQVGKVAGIFAPPRWRPVSADQVARALVEAARRDAAGSTGFWRIPRFAPPRRRSAGGDPTDARAGTNQAWRAPGERSPRNDCCLPRRPPAVPGDRSRARPGPRRRHAHARRQRARRRQPQSRLVGRHLLRPPRAGESRRQQLRAAGTASATGSGGPARRCSSTCRRRWSWTASCRTGERLDARRDGNAYLVTLPPRQREGDTRTVTAYYHGQPGRGRPAAEQRRRLGPGQPRRAVDRDRRPAARRQRLVAPQGLRRRRARQPAHRAHRARLADGGVQRAAPRHHAATPTARTTYEWFVTEPINNYDVAVYAGRYAHFTDTLAGRGRAT